jgi:hypothetical protein
MLNFGKKIRVLRDKKINILTRVVGKNFLSETKNHNSPCKLNGRSLIINIIQYLEFNTYFMKLIAGNQKMNDKLVILDCDL